MEHITLEILLSRTLVDYWLFLINDTENTLLLKRKPYLKNSYEIKSICCIFKRHRCQLAHIHSSYERSIIEKTIQYIKDRTECFDDYFPCRKDSDCKQKHAMNWLSLFVDMHNREIMEKIVK